MNTTLLSRGRRLFYRPGVPNSTARHNVREWVRALRKVGDRWVFAKPLDFRKPR